MSFEVAAESYDRYMGRFAAPLARQFADFAGVAPGQRVLDVGCGPGALTAELVRRIGANAVAAVDPSEPFVAAAAARNPGVDVRHATADDLPFAQRSFDASLAQLVVHFMTDPVAGLTEMARVTRASGIVAACVWDFAGERAPLSPFWRAARDIDPNAEDESRLPGARDGHLAELLQAAGLRDVEETALASSFVYTSFDEWWEPFMLGVGPGGAYVSSLGEDARAELRERARTFLPHGPFTLVAHAWAARGLA